MTTLPSERYIVPCDSMTIMALRTGANRAGARSGRSFAAPNSLAAFLSRASQRLRFSQVPPNLVPGPPHGANVLVGPDSATAISFHGARHARIRWSRPSQVGLSHQ